MLIKVVGLNAGNFRCGSRGTIGLGKRSDALHAGILREPPREGMFAATGADDEEFHELILCEVTNAETKTRQ